MSFDLFTSPDDNERRDRILGGGVNPPHFPKPSLTPSVRGNQSFNVSELQNLMRHGGFFDATDVSTWSNGSHIAYQYPPDFDVFETSVELSQDPYVQKSQLENYFLIKVPIKDENTGTITSDLRLFLKKSIQTRYLGGVDMFRGITNPLQIAYQIRQDITRFPPENPQMIQNYFTHIRNLALSMKGTGHDEAVKNIYEYLTKKINYTWLRDNYFKKMRNGLGVIERFGPKSVGKLVHAVRSRHHRISSTTTSHHSQSGLASIYDGDGVGRGVAGTMLYMLSFLGVQDVHVVEGIAPDPGLAHLRPASGWTEEELIQLRHAWVRIGLQQYDPTRDIGKNTSDYKWFKKTEKEALDLGHEWYGKLPSYIREKLDIPWRALFALGVPLATLALGLHLALSNPEKSHEANNAPILPPPVQLAPPVPVVDDDETVTFSAQNYQNFNPNAPIIKQSGNAFDNLARDPQKNYKIVSYIFRGQRYSPDDNREIRAYGDFVLRSDGQWEFINQPLDASQKINIQYTLSDGTTEDTSILTLDQQLLSLPSLFEVDRDIDKLWSVLKEKGLTEIPENDKKADIIIIDRSGSMEGNHGYENMKFFALLLARLGEKFKIPMTFFAYDNSVEKILDWDEMMTVGMTEEKAQNLLKGMIPRGSADTSIAFAKAVSEAQAYVSGHPQYSGKTRILCFTDGDIRNSEKPGQIDVKGFGLNLGISDEERMVDFFGKDAYTSLNPQEKILEPEVRKQMVKSVLSSFLPQSILSKINLNEVYN